MGMLMIIVSMAVVHTKYLHKTVVHTEIDLLYNTCCSLQHLAMATHHEQELLFDENNHCYSYNGHCHRLPSCVHFGITADAKGPPANPDAPLKAAITFLGKKITFSEQGIIGAGAIYLIDDDHNLYALSSGVGHVSFLRKYRYDGSWKLM
jgi:hypothetical protein